MNRETKLKVKCINKPAKKNFVCVDVTIGNIYEVKQVDSDDFLIIDDKKKLRWYHVDLFVVVDFDTPATINIIKPFNN